MPGSTKRIYRNWDDIIDKLNSRKSGKMTVEMGTPTSAKMTGVRIRREYDGVYTKVENNKLFLSLDPYE